MKNFTSNKLNQQLPPQKPIKGVAHFQSSTATDTQAPNLDEGRRNKEEKDRAMNQESECKITKRAQTSKWAFWKGHEKQIKWRFLDLLGHSI